MESCCQRVALQAACAALRQVLELAREADAVRSKAFTAPIFDLLDNINPDSLPDRAWRWLLSYVEENIPDWREEPAVAEIVKDAYAYLEGLSLPGRRNRPE